MGFAAPSAFAQHYYGVAYLQGDDFLGASGNADVHNIGISYQSDFLDDEIWVADNYTPGCPDGCGDVSWVEAGLTKGVGGGGCTTENYPNFFAAEEYSDGTYVCANTGEASLNTFYGIDIYYLSGGEWEQDVGDYDWSSGDIQTKSDYLQGGVEMTNTDIHNCSDLESMEYKDEDGNWISGWSDSSHGTAELCPPVMATCPGPNSPPYADWNDAPYSMRAYANVGSCT